MKELVIYLLGIGTVPTIYLTGEIYGVLRRSIRDTLKWNKVPLKTGVPKWRRITVVYLSFKESFREQFAAWLGGYRIESGPSDFESK